MSEVSPCRKSIASIRDRPEFIEKPGLEPDETTSLEPISRCKMSENLLFAFNETCNQLETTWNKIGFKTVDRNKRSHVLLYHVENLLKEFVSDEKILLTHLKDRIEKYGQEILQLSEELTIAPPYEPDYSMSTLDLENDLRNKADELTAKKKHRMEQLQELKEREKELCERLAMPPLLISADQIPRIEELRDLEQHVSMLGEEKVSRLKKLLNFKQEISAMVVELEWSPTPELEEDFEREDVILSEEKLTSCKKLLQNLKIQKLDKVKQAEELRKRLSTLWQCVNKDEEERRAFLDDNRGFKTSTVQMLQREVEKCETIRKQNMKLYVENARQSLKTLWKKCCLSEDQIAKVSIIHDDSYTELLLDLHEAELVEWNHYHDQHAEVLDNVMKFENLWTSLKAFEGRPKDPNRFANRGGALLQEEKERRKLEKELKMAENILLKMASAYKKKGENFLVWGKELSEYITEKRETYNSEKKKQQEERKQIKASTSKRSRADTPEQSSKKRPKFGTHLTVPSTSGPGCSTSRKHRISPRSKGRAGVRQKASSPAPKSPSDIDPVPQLLPTTTVLVDVASTYSNFREGVPLSSTAAVLPETDSSPMKE